MLTEFPFLIKSFTKDLPLPTLEIVVSVERNFNTPAFRLRYCMYARDIASKCIATLSAWILT